MTDQGRKYLSDILRSINLIESFVEGMDDFFIYRSDIKTKSAVERHLGIVGEAVNQYRKLDLQFEVTSARQIVTFRNRLIHSYDLVDDTIVWAILKNHLPRLKQEVEKGLSR